MKKLILMGLLLANTANADYLPAGCYVADSYRTDPCWGEGLSYFSWYNYDLSEQSDEAYYYGDAVATLIRQETIYRLGYEQVAEQDKKNKALIKKLKRKCGSACRNIR